MRADSLLAKQQHTPLGFKKHTDFYQQVCIKHPYLSDFHSYPEYLYAGLLEGDPSVRYFVPQPFILLLKGKRYIPDVYVERTDRIEVVELKPRGEFEENKRAALTRYFGLKQMTFCVVANETILSRAQEARNWLSIVSCLYRARQLATDTLEDQLYSSLLLRRQGVLSDWVDKGDRAHSALQEIALFRLAHRGLIVLDLAHAPLDYTTKVSCHALA